MLDNHFEHNGRSDRERGINPADDQGSLTDREVPLSPPGSATADLINRWLDGEEPEPVGLRGDGARALDFWKRVGDETDRRRRMTTPAHVPAKIMASLPHVVPRSSVAQWYRREVRIPAVVLALGAVALVILGALFL